MNLMEPNAHKNSKKGNLKAESKQEKRHVENFERNSSSIESTLNFSKRHGRRFHSFGDGHEPGIMPGTGF